jgi:hypothetical protein
LGGALPTARFEKRPCATSPTIGELVEARQQGALLLFAQFAVDHSIQDHVIQDHVIQDHVIQRFRIGS